MMECHVLVGSHEPQGTVLKVGVLGDNRMENGSKMDID